MRTVRTTWKRADPPGDVRLLSQDHSPAKGLAGRSPGCEWWAAAQDAFLHKDSEACHSRQEPWCPGTQQQVWNFCSVSRKFSLGTGEVNHGDLKLGFADRHRWLLGVQTSSVLYRKGTGWVFSSSRLGPAAHVLLNLPLLLLEPPGSSGCRLYRGKAWTVQSQGSLGKGTAPKGQHVDRRGLDASLLSLAGGQKAGRFWLEVRWWGRVQASPYGKSFPWEGRC